MKSFLWFPPWRRPSGPEAEAPGRLLGQFKVRSSGPGFFTYR